MRPARPVRVYLDATVVINWAARTADALALVDRILSHRQHLLASPFLRLEVEPAHAPKSTAELRLRRRAYFGGARKTVGPSHRVLDRAIELRTRHALGPMDAIHLAVAELSGADVFVTDELPHKPMHKVRLRGTRVLTTAEYLRELR